MEREYSDSDLFGFLAAEFSDSDLDGKSDEEVARGCVRASLVDWHRGIIAEGRALLNAPDFPWRRVGDFANRYFETETEAREWLGNVLDVLDFSIPADLKYTSDMPTPWIERTFQPVLMTPAEHLRLFPVWLLLGPRQAGKSSLLHKCTSGHAYVNLDDLATRERANRDPTLFVRELDPPFTIDEIQYAPRLLSPIKQLVDAGGLAPGAIRLTGSQNFRVMEGVTETLAGRVAILNLLGLSDEEKKLPRILTPDDYFRRLLETGFPRLHGIEDRATRDLYLSSYMQTYIERDIRELLRIEKRREFETFVKLCALRTGQIVNYHDLARDANVSPATVKDWLSVLEDGFLIKLLSPYFTNRTRRMAKSPKLYFLDAGLAAWLGGWRNAPEARLGPMGGALFETHVLADILKRFRHQAREVQVHFWRTRDGQEIDFLVENDGKTFPIEVKLGSPRYTRLPPLERIAESNWQEGQVVSLVAEEKPVRAKKGWTLCAPGALNVAAADG